MLASTPKARGYIEGLAWVLALDSDYHTIFSRMGNLTIEDISNHAQHALNENAKLITERWSLSMDVVDEEERLLDVIKSDLIHAESKALGLNTVAYHGKIQEKN